MATPAEIYSRIRLERVQKALQGNYFEATVHDTLKDAEDHILSEILPACGAKSAGFGGSATLAASDLVARLRALSTIEVIDRNDPSLSPEQRGELSRQSLLVDLFVCSSNAVSMDGDLVNIDMQGNRVAALAYGPRKVALLIGRNKITPDLHSALTRARAIAAGTNAVRYNKDTPCAKIAECKDCKSPDRLCRSILISRRSCPPGRIHCLLIDQDLGF